MAREKDEGGAVWWTPWWVVVVVALVAVSVTSPARAETDDGQDSSNRTTTNSTGVQGNTTEIGADTENGTTSDQNGTLTAQNGTVSNQNGTQSSENGTNPYTNGTMPAESGTVSNQNGTQTAENGTMSGQNGTLPAVNGTGADNGTSSGEGAGSPTDTNTNTTEDTNTNTTDTNTNGTGTGTPGTNATNPSGGARAEGGSCQNDTCANGGVCNVTDGGNVLCMCTDGWTGDTCTDDIDECLAGVCENSDYCENKRGGYMCCCKRGWTGANCTEDIDECANGVNSTSCPDANDDCVNKNGSFECQCHQGYERVAPESNCTEQVILPYNNSKTKREFGDDEVYGPFSIPYGFLLNGQPFVAYFVSINGYITFNTKFSISTMPDVGSPRLVPLAFLAPYWADIDIPQGSATSGLYHVELSLADTFTDNETKALFDEYKMLADLGSDFHPVFISVITWVDVLPYQAGDFANMQPATFQVVLATDGQRLLGKMFWRTVWPRLDVLKVSAWQHLTSHGAQNLMPFTAMPHKASFSANNETQGSTAAQCVEWRKTEGQQLPRGPAGVACPCSLQQARRDAVFSVDESTSCATGRVLDQKDMKQVCCYSASSGMLVKEPTEAKPPVLKSEEDRNAVQDGLQKCCGTTAHNPVACATFQELFPVDTCSRYAAPVTALLWGDPHLITLDGKQYSFNGWGEYVILSTPNTTERRLVVQGRTEKLPDLNVTVFKAYTFKYANTPAFEIHHNGSAQLKIYISGQERDFANAGDSYNDTVHFTDPASDGGSLDIVFSPAVTVKITATSDRLSLSMSAPLGALNGSQGLLGLVDGDITNDFRLRNGTTLSGAAGELTPELLYQFGQSWLLEESESFFQYNMTGADDTFASFQHLDFAPTLVPDNVDELLSELNKTGKMAAGSELCGDNVACLQDFLVTGSLTTASETKGVQDVMEETHGILGRLNTTHKRLDFLVTGSNATTSETKGVQDIMEETYGILDRKPPQFIGQPSVWNITLTSSVFRHNISVSAEASNETLYPDIQHDVTSLPGGVTFNYTFDRLVAGTWQFVWHLGEHVRNVSQLTLTFTASSSVTSMTSVYQPTVVLCACVSQDQCDYFVSSQTIRITAGSQTGTFYMADCQCGDAKGGEFCQDDVNVCDACFNSSSCNTNVTDGNVCTCPAGYEGDDGIKCYEVDECLQKDTCDHECENTVGSYICSCRPGYTLVNGHTCTDVDECRDKTMVNCNDTQFCVNTVGSFQCVCRPGYGGEICTQKVTHVYGGSLVFLALADKGQSWSPDLQQVGTTDFKTLAAKVENTIAQLLSKKNITYVDVTVIKFTLLQSGRRRRSTAGTSNEKIKTTFQVGADSAKDMTSLKDALTSGFDDQCSGDLCRFWADTTDPNSGLYGVSRTLSGFEDDYNLCDSDRNNVCHDASTVCVTANGTYSCMCRQGYQPWSLYDNACQDIDECSLNTTLELCGFASSNSTVCHNTVGSYFCSCPSTHRWDADTMKCQEWTGTCEKDNPCKNGAECVDTLDNAGYACRCTDGWSGPDCGSEDEEARKMKTILIAVGAGLGALCLLLLIALFTLCLVRSRRRKREDRHSQYEMSGTIPRPLVKRVESGPDMERQDSMHKYTDFRRGDKDVGGGHVTNNGSQMQQYANPVFTRADE